MFSWLRAMGRWIEANVVLAPLVITHIRDVKRFMLFGGPRDLSPEDRRERGRRIRLACERLGVTYIKLAQFLTTRPDYVPPEYMEELEKLQDEVPPSPFEEVEKVVEEELGPIDEVFEEFEREPISGASIAQVHRAKLDGRWVAVKIQRPGLEETVKADLLMLRFVKPLASGFLRLVGQRSHADTVDGIIGMFMENIVLEMDFGREKEIMDEIRRHVAEDDDVDDIVIPETVDDLCTDRVITMEYEPGVKIKDVDRLEEMEVGLEHVVETVTDIYLRMPFDYEVFQADPHYGNIAVNEDGEVVVYDYGIAMSIGEFDDERESEELLQAFEALFVGIGLQDADVVVNSMIDMDVIDPGDPDMDMDTIHGLAEILIEDVGGGGIQHEDVEKVEEMMMEEMGDHPLHLHQDVILPFRTTVGIEGLCANVLPEYDFSQKLAEFFVEGGVEIDSRFMEDVVGEYEEERERRRRRRNRKRNALRVGVGGGSVAVAVAAAAAFGPVSLPAAAAYVLAGFGGLYVWNTFQERGPVGPTQYATRYRMEQWEEEDGTREGEVQGADTAEAELD